MRKNALRLISLVELLGGILGILLVVLSIYNFSQGTANAPTLLRAIMLAIPYSLSIAFGWWLWDADPRGVKWSKLIYGLQIPVVLSPLISYEFDCGLQFSAGLLIENFADGSHYAGAHLLNRFFGSGWSIVILPSDPSDPFFTPGVSPDSLSHAFIGLNWFALWAYYELVRAGKFIASRNAEGHTT